VLSIETSYRDSRTCILSRRPRGRRVLSGCRKRGGECIFYLQNVCSITARPIIFLRVSFRRRDRVYYLFLLPAAEDLRLCYQEKCETISYLRDMSWGFLTQYIYKVLDILENFVVLSARSLAAYDCCWYFSQRVKLLRQSENGTIDCIR